MKSSIDDVIIAPITAVGGGAINVVRLSGGGAVSVLKNCLKKNVYQKILQSPRQQHYCNLRIKSSDLDDVLLTYFPKGESYTGEEVVEVSFHASDYILKEFISYCLNCGVRAASPGEFTQRAFLNGKLDLSQAEAVADLISAKSKNQHKCAKENLSGKLSGAMECLAEPLRDCLALIEAQIDFPDEELDQTVLDQWVQILDQAINQVSSYISNFDQGKLLRKGALVAICGIPNAGKSSLLNILLREQRAIVTNLPGTTTDTIEEEILIDGQLIRLCDTAGIEANLSRDVGEVEKIGIERSWQKVEASDLVVFIYDNTQDLELQSTLAEKVKSKKDNILFVSSKVDISPARKGLGFSSKTEEGIQALKKQIIELIGADFSSKDQVWVNERQLSFLLECLKCLEAAKKELKSGSPFEIISFEIMQALNAIDEIVGKTYSDDILGRIFSKFCIGK